MSIAEFPACCGVMCLYYMDSSLGFPDSTLTDRIKNIKQQLNKWPGYVYICCITEVQRPNWEKPLLKCGFRIVSEKIPNPRHSNRTFITTFIHDGKKIVTDFSFMETQELPF